MKRPKYLIQAQTTRIALLAVVWATVGFKASWNAIPPWKVLLPTKSIGQCHAGKGPLPSRSFSKEVKHSGYQQQNNPLNSSSNLTSIASLKKIIIQTYSSCFYSRTTANHFPKNYSTFSNISCFTSRGRNMKKTNKIRPNSEFQNLQRRLVTNLAPPTISRWPKERTNEVDLAKTNGECFILWVYGPPYNLIIECIPMYLSIWSLNKQ